MPRVGIIVGTTRPGRKAGQVARWVHGIAARRADASFEIVDLADFSLPHLDEPTPARGGEYRHAHTLAWAERIGTLDAFVFVTPEYNGSIPGVLKDALDFLYAEWTGKDAGLVGYGIGGGKRAMDHLRYVLGNVRVIAVAEQVSLTFRDDFEEMTRLVPGRGRQGELVAMLDELVAAVGKSSGVVVEG
ncbi:NADPH-dependent oxidoreductase [Streptomyces hoynatensis]|uniref:NADPH-dependent oxidoreductase n=1 Tax=Streptomyces hoynatensis TaxID=1141874 RepID=A0A3A9ZD10_9ACTN|nr:NADPH-dependent oxidoreductase [Streptomyces hoynatensis]